MSNNRGRDKAKRRYQDLWERLKKDKKLTIVCNAIGLVKLKRAISKEKDMDVGFKLECDMDNSVYIIKTSALPAGDDSSMLTGGEPYRIKVEFKLVLRSDCMM